MKAKFNSNKNTNHNPLIPSENMNQPPSLQTENQQPEESNENTNILQIINPKKEEKEPPWVAIPYVGNLSNKIAGILRRKLNWKITFTPGTKILHMLNPIKDEEEHTPPGIYEIPCNNCPATYIGETERPFTVRKDEHEGYVRRKEYKKSAIVKHITRNRSHSINWDNSR